MFVVAYVNLTPSSSTPTPGYQLHRLNLLTLQDTVPPVTITASHTLVDGTSYPFNAAYQRQRPGLLELNWERSFMPGSGAFAITTRNILAAGS